MAIPGAFSNPDWVSLDPTKDELEQARSAILAALSIAHPVEMPDLVQEAVSLAVTDGDRDLARAAILAALPGARQGDMPDLVQAVMSLDPSVDDREQAREVILVNLTALAAEPYPYPGVRGALARTVASLAVTDTDRDHVRAEILAVLPTADSEAVASLAQAVVSLVVTDTDREQARVAILAALPTAEPWTLASAVAALRQVSSAQQWEAWLTGGAV